MVLVAVIHEDSAQVTPPVFMFPSFMEPGGVYRVEVDLQATSNVFLPGHRLRVEVSSSNFPRFDRNLNTGGVTWAESSWITATNTIHHSAKYPSQIWLPVVPAAAR